MRWLLYWLGWSSIRFLSWILFGLKVTGCDNIPKTGGFIFAVNHQSYVDPPMVGSTVRRRLTFFAKKELFEIFLFGTLIGWLNAIPVRRGVYDPEALSRAQESLKRGHGLMLFPEGTRGDGNEFLPPKPGIGMMAKRTGVPIVPAYAHGTSRLKRALTRRQRVRVIIGEPIRPEEIVNFENDKPGYLAIAGLVMDHIRNLREVIEAEQKLKENVS